jgi:8-oxo-dGTP pyrophosphatase MutT (NUDIX family)
LADIHIIKDWRFTSQRYKIYVNEILVFLTNTNALEKVDIINDETLIQHYTGNLEDLKQMISKCKKKASFSKMIIHSDDFIALKKDFKSLYLTVEAAGGLVKNEHNEFLFIFRRGHWDLPKGKMEKNEGKKEAAVREVIEETGIRNVSIQSKIGVTRHAFETKSGKKIIKKSYWYLMDAPKVELTPQIEEDIQKAEWMTLKKFRSCSPIYNNILYIINKYVDEI